MAVTITRQGAAKQRWVVSARRVHTCPLDFRTFGFTHKRKQQATHCNQHMQVVCSGHGGSSNHMPGPPAGR